MIAQLLDRAGLTLAAAAQLCGVTSRTIMNWRDGKTRIPAESLAILEMAAADVELESADPMPLGERIAVLRHIQKEQQQECARLEDELMTTRADLAATTRELKELNALYAERGRKT